MRSLEDRYQNQPWYIKLYRMRHYWLVPHTAIFGFVRYVMITEGLLPGEEPPEEEIIHEEFDDDSWEDIVDFGLFWRLAVCEAEYRMEYYYTLEEVLGPLEEKYSDKD